MSESESDGPDFLGLAMVVPPLFEEPLLEEHAAPPAKRPVARPRKHDRVQVRKMTKWEVTAKMRGRKARNSIRVDREHCRAALKSAAQDMSTDVVRKGAAIKITENKQEQVSEREPAALSHSRAQEGSVQEAAPCEQRHARHVIQRPYKQQRFGLSIPLRPIHHQKRAEDRRPILLDSAGEDVAVSA